jgi:hypothetical protein
MLLFFLFASCCTWAQQTAATLVGTVNDSTGAVVPDAVVRVTNVATNTTRETKTDSAGSYSMPFLPAGDYTVTAAMAGFQSARVERVTLQVQQTARVDFVLKVGEVTETVNVEASIALLQTETSTVGTVIDSSKIVDLPLNGRNFVQLAQLIPGVQAATPGSITVRRGRGSIGQQDAPFGSTGMSANGSRDTANRYFIDGIEFMDYDAMTYSFSPSVDSLSEFKVETSTYSADSGGAPGGQVNMITKRGGNTLHGTLWEFNRNDALTQSYDAIAGKTATPARLNRNQFGGNIGGPVMLPKLYSGKDRTFFFFNWESGRLLQGSTVGYRIVPTPEQRNGDLTGIVDSRTRAPIVLKDPLGVGIVGNKIPPAALSKEAQAFLAYEPLPNTQNGSFNFASSGSSAVSTQDNYNARIDHNFGTKATVSGRYIFNDTYEAGIPFWGHDERNNLGRTQNVSTNYTHTLNPTLINDLRVGWHKFSESEVFGTTNDPDYDVVGKMGLPGVSRLPNEYGPPSISISGPEGGFNTYDLQRQIGPRDRSNSIFQAADSVSWQRGQHYLRFGVDIARRGVTFEQARDPRGSFVFNGTYTGSALADFLLGYVQTGRLNPTHTSTDLTNYWQAYFLNDDWKVTPNLTLNIGLRYDLFGRYTQSDDKFVNIAQNGLIVGDLVTTQTSPYGRHLMASDKNNFGPRFGFAYRPRFLGDAVIRGGYGIYYTPEISNAIFAMAEGGQASAGASVIGNPVTPNLNFSNAFTQASGSGAFPFAVSNDPEMTDSYIQQWNFNIQKKLPGSIVLDTGYVGSKGTDLIVTFGDMNRPVELVVPGTPGLATLNARRPNQAYQRAVTGDKSIGNSIYHALQVKAERRVGAGLTFLTAYTWSKSISGPSDIGGQVGGGFYIGGIQDIYNLQAERAVSGFDIPHRFVQTVLYDLPYFKGTHGFTKLLIDGWQVSTIVTAQSGFGAPIDYGVDTTGTGVGSRPDSTGLPPNLPGDQRTWNRWFNTDAFARPPAGRFGTSPRTTAVRLPGLLNCDFSVNKTFAVNERIRPELRAEIYNLFNHYNPDPQTLDRNIQSQNFGRIGGGVSGITTRVIQIGLKLYF